MRRAFLIGEGRGDTVFDQGRLMLDRLVDDGVELMVGHDFQEVGHQLILSAQTLVVLARVGLALEAFLRSLDHLGKILMLAYFLGCFERWLDAAAVIVSERSFGFAGSAGAF